MAEEERKVSLGFRIFLILCEIVILTVILGGAWLIDKLLLAPPLIIAFRFTRVRIEEKYAVWHLATISACMCVSTLICWFGLYLSLPITVSLVSNIVAGVLFSILTWKIQDYIQLRADYETLKERLNESKDFNTDTCTKEELIKRCEELHFSKENTELAIRFFIEKTKQSVLADELCVDEQSITRRKIRMKSKLNKNC